PVAPLLPAPALEAARAICQPSDGHYAAIMVTLQTAMGFAVASMCAIGLVRSQWILANTNKGRKLADRFGEDRGLIVLRALLAAGLVFGCLLAVDVIRPLKLLGATTLGILTKELR